MPIIVTSTAPEEIAAPPVVDAPSRQVGTLAYQWEAWNGRSWNLVDPSSSVRKLKGSRGFGFSPVTHWYADAAGIPGSSWDGSHDDRSTVFLPLWISGQDSADFLTQHRDFLRSLDPSKTGVLRVTTPDGQTRYALCRYADGLDQQIDLDPVAACDARYGITWDRADPYWLGETIRGTLTNDPPLEFFSPPGSGSVVAIGSSNVLTSAAITNPGDVASYPSWTITGPCSTFQVGIGSSVLAMSPGLVAGESIVADMDPAVLTVVDQAGDDRLGDATDVAFAPIPAGEDIPLTVSATGTGVGFTITLEFAARYRSAW